MSYTIGSDGYLDFSKCSNDNEKIDQCWEFYRKNLADTCIVAADGKTVRGFTEEPSLISSQEAQTGMIPQWNTI